MSKSEFLPKPQKAKEFPSWAVVTLATIAALVLAAGLKQLPTIAEQISIAIHSPNNLGGLGW